MNVGISLNVIKIIHYQKSVSKIHLFIFSIFSDTRLVLSTQRESPVVKRMDYEISRNI